VYFGLPKSLDGVLALQSNVITHSQAIEYGGKTRHQVATLAGNGHWQRLHRGVYYAGAGEVPRDAQLWGVLLRVGHGAVLSHETAAEVWQISDTQSPVIHASVPRKAGPVARPDGVQVHYSVRMPISEFKGAPGLKMPPVIWGEEAVLDLVNSSPTAEDAVNWVIRACQRKKATPDTIGFFMMKPWWRGLHWQGDLREALTEIREGVQSPLERRYLHDVERAHALPKGIRQVRTRIGSTVHYHDVRYIDFGVGVELDGVAYHSGEAWTRDDGRDNTSTLAGIQTLRYGWAQVAYHPCEVAHQVWSVLAVRGFGGEFHRCGPACAAPAKPAAAAEAVARAKQAATAATRQLGQPGRLCRPFRHNRRHGERDRPFQPPPGRADRAFAPYLCVSLRHGPRPRCRQAGLLVPQGPALSAGPCGKSPHHRAVRCRNR
jgi:hypothetical protein